MHTTAIIPAHNEAKTIASVVGVAKTHPLVERVIVVCDGCTDATAECARNAGAEVIEQPQQGKSAAVFAGGRLASESDAFLLLDADLIGLTSRHLTALLEPVCQKQTHMTVGLRDRGFLNKLLPHLPLVGGERALSSLLFHDVASSPNVTGYKLEQALNDACLKRQKTITTIPLKGLTIRTKWQKVGFRRALWQYITMWYQVFFS